MTDQGATADLADGETRQAKGSGSRTYTLANRGGVFSCTCPAWMHQSFPIERRTCKHLKALRGELVEQLRISIPDARSVMPGGAAAPAVGTASRSNQAQAAQPSRSNSTPAAMTAARSTVSPSAVHAAPSSAAPNNKGAPPLLLAHSWEHDVDLTDWWMSEKLDGVRAYWDGTQLLSRLGNRYWAPDWFLKGLPADMPLDGELFAGRKQFQRTVSIVRRQDRGPAWRDISFLVFDAPRHGGPFEDRLRAVETSLKRSALAHVRAHPHERCRGLAHLREELARVETLGGEGLMMRRPGSRYESGRSSSLLKVKTFHDTEAIVVGHLPGAGRHKGRLGALECTLANGTRFSVGTGLSDAERDRPPPIGTIITFRYQELSKDGVPRFPSYVGVRIDADWPPKGTATIEAT